MRYQTEQNLEQNRPESLHVAGDITVPYSMQFFKDVDWKQILNAHKDCLYLFQEKSKSCCVLVYVI